MDRYEIFEEIEEIGSQICMLNNADATCLPEKFVEWATDRFMEDYSEEDPERFPDNYFVLKQMCNYLQEQCNR